MYDKDQTPYTPSIPHLYALKKQLERLEAEGIENRFKRHKEMADYVRNWAKSNGFEKKKHRTNGLTLTEKAEAFFLFICFSAY